MRARQAGWKRARFLVGILILVAIPLLWLGGRTWLRESLSPNTPPVAVIRASATSGEAPLEVVFDASESYDPEGSSLVYQWSLGDGRFEEGMRVQCGFGSPGTYEVRLVVTDSMGKSGTASVSIAVAQPQMRRSAERTFEAQRGVEHDTGTGLRISVAPHPLGGQKTLVVTEIGNPQQPDGEVVELLSVYTVTIADKTGSEQLLLLDAQQASSSVCLTFAIPHGLPSEHAAILEWTDRGWTLAENTTGTPGGTLAADGRAISVTRRQLSRFALSSIGESILDELAKIPDPPPKPPEAKVLSQTQGHSGNWVVTVELYSPYYWRSLGGVHYRVEVDRGSALDVSSGIYLSPGIRQNVVLTFPAAGGDAVVVLKKGYHSLAYAAVDWASRLGVDPGPVVSAVNRLVEAYQRYPHRGSELKAVVWLAKKDLVDALWHLSGKKVKFFVNLIPVSVDIAVHVQASWFCVEADFQPCRDPSFPISVRHPEGTPTPSTSTSRIHPPEAVVLPASAAETEQTIRFTYEVQLGDSNRYFTAVIPPGGNTYSRDFRGLGAPSGHYVGELRYTAPKVGETKVFRIQGQMSPTPQGQSNSDSETVSFTATVLPLPDLTVSPVSAPPSASVGDTIEVTFTVANRGGPVPETFQNRVFLSTTRHGGRGGQTIPLGDFPMSLAGTTSKTETVAVTIPQVPGGNWYIAVYADSTTAIDEGNENNNINSASISITAPPTEDRTPPTIPTNLRATAVSSTQIDLAWAASTDNVGVSGYKVYHAGTFLAQVGATSHSATALAASTRYCFTVSAFDAAGNESGQSRQACATTPAAQQNQPPIIESLTPNATSVQPGDQSRITVSARDPENDPLTYSWSASGGSLSSTTGPGEKAWTAPNTTGTYRITVTVTDNQPGRSPVSRFVDITVHVAPSGGDAVYVDPVSGGEIELKADGTFLMQIMSGLWGTGRYDVSGTTITLRSADGTVIRGRFEDGVIALNLPMFAGAWVKRDRRPPTPGEVVGQYAKEGKPDESLELRGDGSYVRRERGLFGDSLDTTSGRWDLDGHLLTLLPSGFEWASEKGVATGNALYTTTLAELNTWRRAAVSPVADFKFVLSPPELAIAQGAAGTVSVVITRTGGFGEAIEFGVDRAPVGCTIKLEPARVTGSTTTITLTIGTQAQPGTYTLLVRGTGGGISRTAHLTLAVLSPARGKITGMVSDASIGIGISGTTVQASGPSSASASAYAGDYTLPLASGTYTLTVSASGYQSQTKTSVAVAAGQTATVDFALTPTGPAHREVPRHGYAIVVAGTTSFLPQKHMGWLDWLLEVALTSNANNVY